MQVTQVSAFLENRPGRLLYLLNVLADAQVNIIAHNIVDASDFGIVHLLVSDPEQALAAMRAAGLTCSSSEVLIVAVPDEPGAFVHKILMPLAQSGVNIEYSYAYATPETHEARIVLKLSDLTQGKKILAQLER
ncbi:MAG: hypothetical protein LLG44_05815 [Chloroflexi bacterium]|nr:hypothetical protein [Chloroflexota bacterium]